MKSADKRLWAQGVLAELRKHCDFDADNFVHRENLVPHLKRYEMPMEGLAFGKQLQWLEVNCNDC